ncbi:LOG family protein [Nitrococcus mobilis]|uniref:Cytokinin riboside 5'-monophosphate phosphoribohydrolase n=1 Tax=Nitrococcus mobilis Nb-231 TaxID=314278 RepID=A4BSR0_9GAMM|nr:TIGR00730 family Rossman fold protein [Nitrococcus mobilis]EAR21330.1 putative lysine decarboxylase [Nitrococcus mobilis Nb-231]
MKRLCIYCGSSPGRDPVYLEAAQALARRLAHRGIGIVYGGSSVGLMGAMADAALAEGGKVIGVIPDPLMDREPGHPSLTELHVVVSMHQRKAIMAELADGFIALPGGLGTLDELFEILIWAQLGLHRKPCGVLNVKHYYDPLMRLLDHAMEAGFVRPQHRGILVLEADPEVLLMRFEERIAFG